MASNQKKLTLERTLSVIGSTSVGKTALSQKFVMNSFPNEYYPTIEKSWKKFFIITHNYEHTHTH